MLNSVNPISWITTAAFIRREQPDLLIARYWLPFMGPSLGTVIRRVKRSLKTKVIAITDNVIPHESRAFDRPFTSWFLHACDAFMTMSDSVAKDLITFKVKGPIRTEPHPVYDIFGPPMDRKLAREQLKLNKDDKLVLFFGFIRHYKGLDLLLEAMADERIKSAGIKLLVAGEFYDDAKPYHAIIEKHGLTDRVILHHHYIPKDKVKAYFGAADIVAQPYRTATQSGVTQIAYHLGRAMLVTNVGGLPEIVTNGKAGYVTNADPTEIASGLSDFFENNRAAEMELFVSKQASKFTWSAFAHSLLELAKN